ncbi:MAG: S-layer homology domain-containing protein, partial [Oscillospiraceae bacterium]|nr:S-layer homology domain-containing protein [Oscillospiraceae bacterium]
MFKRLKRGLCLLLVCCLLLTLVPLSAMAGDLESPESGPVTTMREPRTDRDIEPRAYAKLNASLVAASGDQIEALATPPAAISSIFADPTIARVIAELFGRAPSAGITQAELDMVGWIVIIGYDVQNLQGLQFLRNLTELELGNNQISDLRPLAGLHQLEWLGLGVNQISDLSPLSGLTRLEVLDLGANWISDLWPLAGLHHLAWLALDMNQISDLSPLSGLTRLGVLDLGANWISNLWPIAGLHQLWWLALDWNQISDLGPLSGLTWLEELWLCHNWISNLGPLSGLTNLELLGLSYNQVYDLRPLRDMHRLRYNFVHDQEITLSPAMVTGGTLTIANPLRTSEGHLVAPQRISDDGFWQFPYFRWTGLQANVEYVSVYFGQGGFGGRIIIPLTDTPFTDVNRGHWFNSAVAFVFNEGVMTGTTATTFSPADTLTRAQVARMLWNMAGQPPVAFSPIFTDVPATAPDWYRDAVIW